MLFPEINDAKRSPDPYRKTKFTHQVIYFVQGSILALLQKPTHSTPTTAPRVDTIIICVAQGRIPRQSDKGTCPVSYMSNRQNGGLSRDSLAPEFMLLIHTIRP